MTLSILGCGREKNCLQCKILWSAFLIVLLCRGERELTGFPKELPPEEGRLQKGLYREAWAAAIAYAGICSAVSGDLWLRSCWSSALKELNAVQMEACEVTAWKYDMQMMGVSRKRGGIRPVRLFVQCGECLSCVAVKIWALAPQLSSSGSPAQSHGSDAWQESHRPLTSYLLSPEISYVPGCAPAVPQLPGCRSQNR